MEEHKIQFKLIKNGLRTGYLFSESDKKILEDAIEEGLYIYKLFNFYIVTLNYSGKIETKEEIGKILGYHCYEYNFKMLYEDRIEIRVTEENNKVIIYSEICDADNYKELTEIYINKMFQWNSVLPEFNFTFKIINCNYSLENIDTYNYEEFMSEIHIFEKLSKKYMKKDNILEWMKQNPENFEKYKVFYKQLLINKINKLYSY